MEPVKRKRRDKRREWGGPYTYNGKARVPRNAGFNTLVQHERNSQRADNRLILIEYFIKIYNRNEVLKESAHYVLDSLWLDTDVAGG